MTDVQEIIIINMANRLNQNIMVGQIAI